MRSIFDDVVNERKAVRRPEECEGRAAFAVALTTVRVASILSLSDTGS
jgi:hypothetical protein